MRALRHVTLVACLVLLSPWASAEEEDPRTKPVFNTDHGLMQILSAAMHQRKSLVVKITGGVTYTGAVKSVGTEAVILTRLGGKEFFDVWIPMSSIIAIEERVRLQ